MGIEAFLPFFEHQLLHMQISEVLSTICSKYFVLFRLLLADLLPDCGLMIYSVFSLVVNLVLKAYKTVYVVLIDGVF